MRRGAAAALVVGLLAGGFGARQQAHADFSWCWDDPVVQIDHVTVSTTVRVFADPAALHGYHATIVYTVPKGVSTQLVSQTSNALKEKVRFETTDVAWAPNQPVPVTVTVDFNHNDAYAADMTNGAPGVNKTVSGDTSGVLSSSFTLH